MGNSMIEIITIDQVKRRHKGHWFEPSTMRFFKSRTSSYAYRGPGGIYFVSSEKGPDNVRRYTVRTQTAEGSIESASAFQAYLSRSGAQALALHLAKGEKSHVQQENVRD